MLDKSLATVINGVGMCNLPVERSVRQNKMPARLPPPVPGRLGSEGWRLSTLQVPGAESLEALLSLMQSILCKHKYRLSIDASQ